MRRNNFQFESIYQLDLSGTSVIKLCRRLRLLSTQKQLFTAMLRNIGALYLLVVLYA